MTEHAEIEALKQRIRELEQNTCDCTRIKQDFDHQKQTLDIVLKIAADCIHTSLEKIPETIQSSLTRIGEFTGVDRAYVFDYDFDKNIGVNTFEWCRKGVEPQIHHLQATPLETVSEWVEIHRKGEPMIIPDVSALPRGNLKEILEMQQIKSLAAVPIYDDDRLDGFAGFDSVHPFHSYSDREVELLKIFVSLLTSLNKRRHAQAVWSRLTAILESTTDLVFTATPDAQLTYLNRAGRIMAGWDADESLDGRLIDDLHSDEVLERIKSEGMSAARDNGSWKGETTVLHRDGRQIPVSQVILGHSSEKGDIAFYSTIMRDISDRIQAEAEQKRLHAQLLQAQKMESIGRLAGGVAHDFNNMLNIILGYSELSLKKLNPADQLYGRLQKIHHAADRSAGITRQLLAFARKQTITPRILDINETLEGMLKMLRRVIGENIDLVWKPGKKLRHLKMDPVQIDQILVNLCINARDAIADVGKVTIETDMVYIDESYCQNNAVFIPGHYILLTVSDNGCGMDAHARDNLFEPFFTTKQKGKGTGLGLSTVYGIVRQNNGFIHVYSESGRGATFRIYLPPHHTACADSPEPDIIDIPTGNGETILIVEDETVNLEMLASMLNQLNYQVLTAEKPSQALDLCRTHTGIIALMITDVVMPEMNGKDLAAQVTGFAPDIRILFMSGYTANVIAHQGVLDENIPFLEKPFSLLVLARKIRQVLAMPGPEVPV